MIKFNVVELLDDLNIDYKEKGSNVMKEHVAINCPVCGNDPSCHMNVKIDGTHAICFICGVHYKNNPFTIIRALYGEELTYGEILDITKKFPFDSFEEPVEKVECTDCTVKELKFNNWWNSFVPIRKAPREYKNYVWLRGLQLKFCTQMDIRVDVQDNRVILPIRDIEGKIVNFVGRSIVNSRLRYKNCPSSIAIKSSGTCLFGLYESEKKKRGNLLIVEGIIDCMKLLQCGIDAVALTKKILSGEQQDLLIETLESTTKVFVALDEDTKHRERMDIHDLLIPYFKTVKILRLPTKDIGECSTAELVKLKKLLA